MCVLCFVFENAFQQLWCVGQIGVLAFADSVEFPADPCYSRGLSLATPTNKNKLKNEFIPGIQPSITSAANFSKAFSEAFRLLANVDTDNSSDSTNNQRGSLRGVHFTHLILFSTQGPLAKRAICSANVLPTSIALVKRGGCFYWGLFVWFICQHDNFRTIKRRMMKLGDCVHCPKISPEFEFGGHRLYSQFPTPKTVAFC